MEPSTENSLFQTSLNSLGKEWVRKFGKIVKWVIIVGIIGAITEFILNFIRLIYLSPLLKKGSLPATENIIICGWTFIYLALFIVQLKLYNRVAQKLQIAVESNDEVTFNYAFKDLYKFALMGFIIGLGQIAPLIFQLILSFKYYRILN